MAFIGVRKKVTQKVKERIEKFQNAGTKQHENLKSKVGNIE